MTAGRGRLLTALLALGATLVQAGPATADIVWDFSPATTMAETGTTYSNDSDLNNFAERISFAATQTLTGMDIYTNSELPFVGQSVTIRLWSDSAGIPGSLLTGFTETLSIVDSDGLLATQTLLRRAYAAFTVPLVLSENTTYWIGMSGTSTNLGQQSLFGLNAPDNNRMSLMSGTGYSLTTTAGDMAFRLHGPTPAVPEPGTLASGLLGLLLVGGVWCLRRGRD